MKTTEFLDQLDDAKLTAAIQRAERASSGEVRIFVTNSNIADIYAGARQQFQKLAMHKTRDRNAVLIYIAPKSQGFAIIGDEGIHAKGGDTLWKSLAGDMESCFRQHDFTGGIIKVIDRVGQILAQHFPPRPDDQNELPDSIVREP